MNMYMPNMELHVLIHCLPLLLVLLAVDAYESNNNATESSRLPRSSRRVVRLYSGTRPDPLVCLGEGFQADPVNCAVFYRCLKSSRGRFMSFKFQCAPGTIYDPEKEVCNHPSIVKRFGCGIEHTVSVSDQIPDNGEQIPDNAIEEIRQELPSPISTKHPFYTQISNSSTKNPWMTSSKLQDISTVYPWLTSTNDQNKLSSVPTKLSTAQTTNNIFTEPSLSSTKKHRSTTPRVSSITREHSVQNGDLCRSEGFMGDSENCRKFYRCISNLRGGYIRYEFMCTESTIWDDDIQSCNHAWAVKRRRCGRGNANDETNVQENKKDVHQDYTTHRIISSGSQQQTNHSLLVSPTKESSSYITQSQTKTTVMKTTVKTNPTTIYPIYVRQTQNVYSTEKRTTSPENEYKDNGYNNRYTGSNDESAANECSKSGFMGDKNDCKKFYRCVVNGRGSYTRYEFSCGEGTVWDPNLEACNHAWAVKECGDRGPIQDAGTTTTSSPSTSRGTSTKSTTVYTTTTTKQPQTTTEDNEDVGYGNQNKNPTTISTTTQSASSIATPVTKQPGGSCSSSGFMADENDCKKFYRCVDNGGGSFTRYEFTCGEGTVWDSNLEACNHAWAVKECGGKGTTQSSETTTTSSPIVTSATSTQLTSSYVPSSQTTTDDDENVGYGNNGQETTSTSTTISSSSSTATEITKQPGNSCTASGFMGDENDCKKFYRCVDNGNGAYTRYEFSCGEGTVWDSNIEACNHPWAVPKCGGSLSSTTEKVKPTTTVTHTTTYTSQTAQTQNDDSESDYGIQHDENQATSTSTSISTSKEPQHSSNNCISTGFMGDKYDCKKFYRCVDNSNGGFTRYEFTCGEGTVWDAEIEACNHVWAVEKCGGLSNEINKEEQTASQLTTVSSSTVSSTSDDNEIDTGYEQSSSQPTIVSSSESPSEENEVQTSNECKFNGFIGDKDNCKKFYRCVENDNGGYTRYEFTCGEGTVWDPKVQACNHDWAVENCRGHSTDLNKEETTTVRDSSTSSSSSVSTSENINESTTVISTTQIPPNDSNNSCTSPGFMRDNKDCKKFYRCVDNGSGGYIKYEFKCGDGTVWNQEIQACDHDNGRPCSNNVDTSVSKQPENDEMYSDSNTTKEPSSSESPATGITSEIQSPIQSIATCQSEGFYGDLSDCKKFYRCVDNGKGSFTKYDFTCGDGTVWYQEIQACDHESNNKCRTSSAGNETGPKPTTNPVSSSTLPYTDASTTLSSITENQSPQSSTANDTCTSEGFYANSIDCRRFYRCVDNGKGGYSKYEFSCGEGTMWVQEIQACDHLDDESNCSSSGTTNNQQLEGQQSITGQQSSSTSSSYISSTTMAEPADKPNDEYQENQTNTQDDNNCSAEGFYPNKNDCRKFYRCVDNGQGSYTKYDFSCGEGTAWDTDIQTCNHISEVSRCRASHEDNPDKPMQDEGVSQTTQASSLTEKTTTSSSESSKPTSKDTCESEGYFGNTDDCTKFYRCVDNGNGGYTKYDFDCGEGTIWDQDVQTCNHPQDVVNPSCNQSNEQSETSSSSSSTTQSSSNNTESTSQSSSNCSSENTTKKPTNQNITCEKAGYYPNPSDCKKFYRCVDWDGNGERFSVYHFECGEGTIWDPQLDTCNHEESVYPPRDCSGVQYQTESVQQTSTEGSSQQTTESTTEGSTTTEQSTSQETTTQQLTTKDGTTTQQTTTTGSTTTQLSTTTASTTTQQSLTTESTTTQQSANTEETTTQQSTTSETSTPATQQSTTESTTTQQATEGTTTQQSTTESTTIQQTTEGTTTQQSTTESTTIQQPTEGTTIQQSTTESTTIQQTTEGTTTQKSTTESTTTQETTEGTTAQQSTTESTTTEQTTEGTTTQKSTTDSTTTEHSTTEGTTSQHTEQTTSQESTTAENTQQTTTSESTTSQTDSSETMGSSNTEPSTDNQSTTESMSTTESGSNSKECPDTDEDQYLYVCPTSFRRHPKYCNMFYQCTEDDDSHDPKIAVFTCPNNTIYDESKTQCVEESKADKKCDGEIAQRRRIKRLDTYYKEPIVVGRDKYSCTSTGYYPFEKTSECSPAFLKCQKAKSGQLRGYVHLCPEGYLYWSISKRCERKGSLKDCKTSANDWSRRWELPVERKNVAL